MIHSKRNAGFTLTELIAIILVVSVLSVTALYSQTGGGARLNIQVDELVSDIRYIQSYAVSRGQRFRINFPTATAYTLTNLTGAVAVPHPVRNSNQIVLEDGVSLTSTNSFIVFDGMGVPYINDTTPYIPLSSDAIISISHSGQSRSIRVSPETGRVLVQ